MRLLDPEELETYKVISIHAPMKGATPAPATIVTPAVNFNPRTHEGCDDDDPVIDKVEQDISIHAPMKGAT